MKQAYQTDIAIVGGGIAGIVAAIELLDQNKSVTILDGNGPERLGGLANEAFGGMTLINTPLQRLNGIKDSAELALADWENSAEFGPDDHWPRQWARTYVERSREDIYCWLKTKGIRFFPAVQWVERGDFIAGNSVPRYHIVWGTGWSLTQTLIRHLQAHPNRQRLTLLFDHRVEQLEHNQGGVTGCSGNNAKGEYIVHADQLVLACGGINGNLDKVREVWDPIYGPAPKKLLNGSHPSANGHLHANVCAMGGQVTHLNWMWNYAAGIAHPKPDFEGQGLSLIPPRSALWLDSEGKRIGPKPLVTGFDTHDLCKQIGHLTHQVSWQVMNWKIAIKEIAISGSHMNPSFRDKKFVQVLKETLLGNTSLVAWMIESCPDVVAADSLEALADKMQAINEGIPINKVQMLKDIARYDHQLDQGEAFHNDDQLRRIAHLRQWRGDKVRTCRYQKINTDNVGPFIAIREQLISRKSMGGMQTDLQSRVLDTQGAPISGLYAVGEAAGFGGGGISGIRSLEGTFLSSCILTSRYAARSILGGYAA
jgi:predicted oxidoreductase